MKTKKLWTKEYAVTKNSSVKHKTFSISKWRLPRGDFYFVSFSPKRTSGTWHRTFGTAFQFGNKKYA